MELNVMYSTDENYARYCGTSIYSLFDNNKDIEKINIFVVEDNVKEKTKNIFFDMAKKFNRNLKFINIDDVCNEFSKNNNFPKAAFARLFAENIDENIDKILYLDCDTIINDSLRKLWNTNIEDYYIAAIQDPIQTFNVQLIGLPKEFRYINSGVLLINLKKWRKDNLKQKFIDSMTEYVGKVPHHDQGILNIVCRDYILYLNPKYNLMPEMICMNSSQLKEIYKMTNFYENEELEMARIKPCIIHYITKWYNRPWYKSCTHPLKEKFIEYLNKTEFNKELLDGQLKKRILLQKKIFEKMPFCFFIVFQRLFDIRRKIIVALNIEKRK